MPTTINGTGITFPNGTTQTTAASGAGTVTSVATGNGLQGGTITTSGTLSVACPTFNTVGSYAFVAANRAQNPPSYTMTSGSNYSPGTTGSGLTATCGRYDFSAGSFSSSEGGTVISGTWKWMSGTQGGTYSVMTGIACRVS